MFCSHGTTLTARKFRRLAVQKNLQIRGRIFSRHGVVTWIRGNSAGRGEEETLDCEHEKCRFITRFAWKYYGLNAKCHLANGYELQSFPSTKATLCWRPLTV